MASSSKPVAVLFGARGFVGSALARALPFPQVGFARADADFTDAAAVAALAPRIPGGATWIITAARNPDCAGPADACRSENAAIAANIAGLIAHASPRSMIYLSSVDVYGRSGIALPLDEDSPTRPQSPYAEGKLLAEEALGAACSAAGVPLTILRLPGVYGPGDTHHGPIRSFVDAAVAGREIVVYGDGEQVRDLLFIDDLVAIVSRLIAQPHPGVFNAVSGTSHTLNAMLEILRHLSGRALLVRYERAPQYDLRFRPSALLAHDNLISLTPLAAGLRVTYTRALAEVNPGERGGNYE